MKRMNKLLCSLVATLLISLGLGTIFGNSLSAAGTEKIEDLVAYAKWTSGGDHIGKAIDGVISYGNNPANRWTDWKRTDQLEKNWITLVFGSTVDIREANIDSLDIHFYQDSGCYLPANYEIEYFTGEELSELPDNYGYAADSILDNDANWSTVNYVQKPAPVLSGVTVIEFEEVQTKAIRINLDAQVDKSLAVTEVMAYGNLIDQSSVKQGMTNIELINAIDQLEYLSPSDKTDFTDKIGLSNNEAILQMAKEADARLEEFETVAPPEKPEMPDFEGPIYGGWFRTWHDEYSDPNEDRPNYFGDIPEEVDIAFVFHAYTEEYSEFWKVLREEYIPKLNNQGTRVMRTMSVRNMFMDLQDAPEPYPNTPEGNRARAEFIVKNYVEKHGLDGLDVDIEWHDTYANGYGIPFTDGSDVEKQTIAVLNEIADIMHEKGLLFMIDTNMTADVKVLSETIPNADYLLLQAYGSMGENYLDYKWAGFSQLIKPEKFLLGFSFYEEGDTWNMWNDISDRVLGSRAERYAKWQPEEGDKAGIMAYAIDRDGVAFGDDKIYKTEYNLSKELKNIMMTDYLIKQAKADLEKLLNEAENIERDRLVSADAEKLSELQDTAQTLLDASEDDLDELSNAVSEFEEFMENYEYLGDKTELVELIEEAKATEPEHFTEDSIANLNAAIEYAEAIVDDNDASETLVENGLALLHEALVSLEVPTETEPSESETETSEEIQKEILRFLDDKNVFSVNEKISFKINSDPEFLLNMIIDGETIDRALYSLEKGSTIVTLSDQLANKLAIGKHNIVFEYSEANEFQAGKLSMDFEIVAASDNTSETDEVKESDKTTETAEHNKDETVSKTGEMISPIIPLLLVLAIASVVAGLVIRRRDNFEI